MTCRRSYTTTGLIAPSPVPDSLESVIPQSAGEGRSQSGVGVAWLPVPHVVQKVTKSRKTKRVYPKRIRFPRARCRKATKPLSHPEKRYYWGSFQSFDLPLIPSGKRPQVVSVSLVRHPPHPQGDRGPGSRKNEACNPWTGMQASGANQSKLDQRMPTLYQKFKHCAIARWNT